MGLQAGDKCLNEDDNIEVDRQASYTILIAVSLLRTTSYGPGVSDEHSHVLVNEQ
jgi:hypothetical protein